MVADLLFHSLGYKKGVCRSSLIGVIFDGAPLLLRCPTAVEAMSYAHQGFGDTDAPLAHHLLRRPTTDEAQRDIPSQVNAMMLLELSMAFWMRAEAMRLLHTGSLATSEFANPVSQNLFRYQNGNVCPRTIPEIYSSALRQS